MADATKTIKRLMHDLEPDQLEIVRSYATMLIGNGMAAPPASQARKEDMHLIYLEMICAHMKLVGADFTSYHALRKNASYKSFEQKLTDLDDFFQQAVDRNRVSLRALFGLSVDLLYRNLIELNVPISSRAMMNHIHRIPSVLNAAFPGYAAAGMLHLVIRRSTDVRKEPNLRKKRVQRRG